MLPYISLTGGHRMRTHIIKIGNSQGIRIPKSLLEQSGITADVELEAEKHRIVIRPIRTARYGWESAFKRMAQNGDDILEDGEDIISQTTDNGQRTTNE